MEYEIVGGNAFPSVLILKMKSMQLGTPPWVAALSCEYLLDSSPPTLSPNVGADEKLSIPIIAQDTASLSRVKPLFQVNK